MGRRGLIILSVLLWWLASGVATATTSPAKVVQQFIDAHLKGNFAAARSLTLEQVNLSISPFSSWIFGPRGAGGDGATADVFLSRRFAQVFRYTLLGTTPSGDNQVFVTVLRTSPNLIHMYTWALAPKRGATPYELIEAIDTYLTRVNFPIEESRMQFTLIREVDEWYIRAIRDEKFVQLQQQWLSPHPISAVTVPAATPVPSLLEAASATPPPATTTSDNPGRRIADAQFNATLQSFNRTYQPPASRPSPQPKEESQGQPSFLGRIANLFGGGKKKQTVARLSDAGLKKTFSDIRDTMARYSAGNNGYLPAGSDIYDWQSLRELINRYGRQPLPATEAEVGFSFVQYRTFGDDYTLLFELHEPKDGVKRVEVTPYGVALGG
ncbi:hypothetical protein NKDENANG_02323 [Candidatus Entotheonellaceae bacterium PAL068K]